MNSLKLKLVGAAILLASSFFSIQWIAGLPEHYRHQGRMEVRATYELASSNAVAKAERDLKNTEEQLRIERGNHAIERAKQSEKFNDYVADVRAGRVPGLHINKASICTTGSEKATSPSGTVEETSVRLPKNVEEGLFRFANDRDQIIFDFEAFKQEVRVAKCFAN